MFVRRKRGQVLLVHNVRVEGRVVQRRLAAFGSAPELEGVLTVDGWPRWLAALARSHPDIAYDGNELRLKLEEALAHWHSESAPGPGKLVRLAEALDAELAATTPASPGDAAVLDASRPLLTRLATNLDRVLGRNSRHAAAARPGTRRRSESTMAPEISADDRFDEAMEHWWRGEHRAAVTGFRRVLQADPRHADAHNRLGIAAMEANEVGAAENHFRAAIEGAARQIEIHQGFLGWGSRENRPYLRAHASLAQVFRLTRRWADAAKIHEQLLRWNPNDNQGVRFLLGEEYYRMGLVDRAIGAYERAGDSDPAICFGAGLALLDVGREGTALWWARGVGRNGYVVPMLLGEPWERVPGRHPNDLAEPEWAARYLEGCGDLWLRRPEWLDRLAELWSDPRLRAWRADLDHLMVGLEHTRGEERRDLLERYERSTDEAWIRRLIGDSPPPAALGVERAVDVGPPQRFSVGDTWVIDMGEVLGLVGADGLAAQTRRLNEYVGRIVEAVSAWDDTLPIDSAIRCRRRPRNRPCPGHVRAWCVEGTIQWSCTRCRDNGRISNWRGTPWDIATDEPTVELVAVPVSVSSYDELRGLELGLARRPVARAFHRHDGAELLGTPAEFGALLFGVERAGSGDLAGFLRSALAQVG